MESSQQNCDSEGAFFLLFVHYTRGNLNQPTKIKPLCNVICCNYLFPLENQSGIQKNLFELNTTAYKKIRIFGGVLNSGNVFKKGKRTHTHVHLSLFYSLHVRSTLYRLPIGFVVYYYVKYNIYDTNKNRLEYIIGDCGDLYRRWSRCKTHQSFFRVGFVKAVCDAIGTAEKRNSRDPDHKP